MVKVYNYDRWNGVYTGSENATESPLEPGVWLLPADATFIEPPSDIKNYQVPVWNGTQWFIINLLEENSNTLNTTIFQGPLLNMNLIYEDKIDSLKAINRIDSSTNVVQSNVVIQVNWTRTGTTPDGISSSYNSVVRFESNLPTGDEFIEFSDLTEDIILSWVYENLIEGTEDFINRQVINGIEMQLIQEKEVDLPWSSNSSVGISTSTETDPVGISTSTEEEIPNIIEI